MSDFLSKFTRDQYAEMVKKEEKDKAEGRSTQTEQRPSRLPDTFDHEEDPISEPVAESMETPPTEDMPFLGKEEEPVADAPDDLPEVEEQIEDLSVRDVPSAPPERAPHTPTKKAPPVSRARSYSEEETVIDPEYRKKQRRKYLLLSVVGVLLLLLIAFGVYRFTHVRMPDFQDKAVSDARVWGAQNRIEFLLDQVYSKEHAPNTVIHQSDTQNKMVRKGSTLTLQVSLGPDPEEIIPLPDFSTYSIEQAREWVEENLASNLSIVNQYSDTVEKGRFLSLNITDSNVTPELYQRKNTAIAYFSRGPEVFEKNIVVPDFTGKSKSEVDTWASTNSLKLSVKETTSNTHEAGFVISQSVPKGEKVARQDPFEITVSLGKAIIVPDFNDYDMNNAHEVTDVTVQMLTRFSEFIPYGQLISQSLPAGSKLTDKDDRTVTVVYSLGLPYLKDLRDTMNEGELQKYFFDEFQSKDANISYSVTYANSPSPKGTVIYQSTYETLLPLTYNVRLTISLGDGTSIDPPITPPSGKPKD